MNRRTLTIAISAALVSLVLGYGLLGLAAPDAGAPSTDPVTVGSLDLAALASTFTGPDGVPPRIVVVEEPAAPTAATARRGDDDDRYEDHDDDHDEGRWGDDDD